MNWYDAQNWLDLVDHAWYGLVLIAVAAVPAYFARKNHEAIQTINRKADTHHEAIQTVNRKTDTLVGNVQNGHTEPLRADVDRAIAGIEALSHDVRGLRQDMAATDDLRRQQITELRSEIEHRAGRRHQ